ncbi:DNA polymerase III subunit chi [Pseudohoeflea coraliihabitans]|uniref:DNA polymerase III subunit chi n=1 Tax=Pseudohoeflea coraliihabitans TaxID=2860393 RepID=A0ABS6WRX5_9HYPH|nr:DNA polymerase III subunit chi [Pseudohoeflea sp. DP4N28-3]MBW3098716.1 DNA polymerase III subunit chi [Pseudohoeflea sp. DP4N28-3]
MVEVLFYHLTESRLDDALPILLEKSLDRGGRVSVHADSEERRDALDAHLWVFRDDSFLPHGIDRGEGDANAARQPVLLTMAVQPANGATVRFAVGGAAIPALEGCERLVVMFDGHDAAQLQAAREQWKTLKREGHTLTYWQQSEDRRWQRKA